MCVVADKDRELSEAQAEIKALKHSERLREKAVEEVACDFQFPCIHFILNFQKGLCEFCFLLILEVF
jgi:hypothetical protein